jgi:hypothetical protein
MESYLATIAGRSRNDAIAKAQDVMYDAWERTTSRSRVALARKALGISPLCSRRVQAGTGALADHVREHSASGHSFGRRSTTCAPATRSWSGNGTGWPGH